MTRTDFAAVHCSIARTFDVLADAWTAMIVRDLHLGLDRFDELVGDLGISRKVLAERLATLVDAGLVIAEPYQDRPVRHRYRLTSAGLDLVPVLLAVMAWGDRWRSEPNGPPVLLRHGDHACVPEVVCATCRAAIDPAAVTARVGPGGRTARGTALIGTRLER